MFSNFSPSRLELLYLGLKSLIEGKTGKGFHNNDMSHPVYDFGSKGETPESFAYADSPEKNNLFIMLSALTKELKDRGIEDHTYIWWYDFSTWQNFCQFAVGCTVKPEPEKH